MAITESTDRLYDELLSLLEEHSKSVTSDKFKALTETRLADHQLRCDRIIELLDQLTISPVTTLN
jgi:hypothetical protein